MMPSDSMSSRIRITRRRFSYSLLALVANVTACQSRTETLPNISNPSPGNATTTSSSGREVLLYGAGSAFVAPMLKQAFSEYNKLHPNTEGSYQSIGSESGIMQFTYGTVDFAASDAPMTDEQTAKVSRGVLFVPITANSVVLIYNLPNIKSRLKLSRAVYTDIFLGKLTKWNDSKIATLNPDAKLPDLPITFVHPSDVSGTTYILTNHISTISPEWKQKVGVGTEVNWSIGVSSKDDEGVSAKIRQTAGAIAYVDYAHAIQKEIPFAQLENKDGQYVEATPQTITNSLNQIELSENLKVFEPDPSGLDSYPIVGFTWLLVYKTGYTDTKKLNALKDFIKWSLKDGQKVATKPLKYIPIPSSISNKAIAALNNVGKAQPAS